MKSLNAKIDALERRRGWLPPKEAREMIKATDAALASLEEDEVDASGFQGWTLEAWLGSIDLAAIFSDALLHHFASGALTKKVRVRVRVRALSLTLTLTLTLTPTPTLTLTLTLTRTRAKSSPYARSGSSGPRLSPRLRAAT